MGASLPRITSSAGEQSCWADIGLEERAAGGRRGTSAGAPTDTGSRRSTGEIETGERYGFR
jgi:hypothetical protein